MDYGEIRSYCLKKKGVEESLPFDDNSLVFKVGGKIFLILDLTSSPVEFNAKCDPDQAIDWREKYGSVRPGYHMNKKHWNTVNCDGQIKKELIYKMIDHSYDLVWGGLSKKIKVLLQG